MTCCALYLLFVQRLGMDIQHILEWRTCVCSKRLPNLFATLPFPFMAQSYQSLSFPKNLNFGYILKEVSKYGGVLSQPWIFTECKNYMKSSNFQTSVFSGIHLENTVCFVVVFGTLKYWSYNTCWPLCHSMAHPANYLSSRTRSTSWFFAVLTKTVSFVDVALT